MSPYDQRMRSKIELMLGGGEDPTCVPLQLAHVHRDTEVGDELTIEMRVAKPGDHPRFDRMPNLEDLVIGAGFGVNRSTVESADVGSQSVVIEVTRLRTLPDYLSDRMDIVVCGLNPSLHSADLKVGFGRGGNRFWPAALAAGLATIDRDPIDALVNHGIGMTDLVKRATPKAASLTVDEYAAGVRRLENICEWLSPKVVCMVGLAGWRAAVDRKAVAGLHPRRLGPSQVYVMPSTSGLNAHSSLSDLTAHLQRAIALAGGHIN